ncbi:ROK family transcriptional regulator [Saccharothrix variisporea]|uniref:Putative NBD/HSP70 family sugar kinase n=1 Tax=Saccharothrix variisporea TaxID=543527 RepID=A0A495XKA7_9PSEU|nr:ROK family transcriptional regulator [Saccharothrix variisporea]RKT74547.1 putative NBD/HSP70 family sugar kinase [Saccharothrix variisporea]
MARSPVWASRPRTRGLVLDLIRAARTISRVELATATGLTGATISEVVRELIGDGLVVEAGRGLPTGGKPRTLVQLNPVARYSVGVQLERNACVIVVVDLAGRPVARTAFHGVASMPPERALPLVAAQVDALLTTAGVDRGKVLGVGLVSYGPQDRGAGVLLTPQPTEEWYDHPVAPRLAEILDLPVLLDNDAAAAAIGEYWLGAVDPDSTYGCIYMATGIGGGVVVAGEVYRGSTSNTAEIGHISVDVHGEECSCGNVGCLENYAGPSAVVRQAAQTPDLARRLALDPAGEDFLTEFARIAAAANAGDPQARELVERSARYLGHAAVTVATLFDLDLVVLAGPSFTVAGSIYQAVVQDQLDRRLFARRAHSVRVVPSVNGSDAAAIGGAVLVLQSELVRGRHDEARPVPTGAGGTP